MKISGSGHELVDCSIQTKQSNHMSRDAKKPVFDVPAQIDQYGHRNFGFTEKKRNCTIRVAKTKALISFAVTAKLICAFVFA